MLTGILKFFQFFIVCLFLAGFFLTAADLSFAQIDCSKLSPEDLKEPKSCNIYQTQEECENNICEIETFCNWKNNTCVGLKGKLKPLEIQYPNLPGYGTIKPNTTPAEYIRYVFVFGLWILGIVALSMLIYAGVLWVFSGANTDAKAHAMKITQNIVIGVFLFLASYLILNTLNPELLKLNNKIGENLPELTIHKPDYCENVKNCEDYQSFNFFRNNEGLRLVKILCETNPCQVETSCKVDKDALDKFLNNFSFGIIDLNTVICKSM